MKEREPKGTGRVFFGSDTEAVQREQVQADLPTAEEAMVTPQERFTNIYAAIEEIAGTYPEATRNRILNKLYGHG